jgi:hypothetical protein
MSQYNYVPYCQSFLNDPHINPITQGEFSEEIYNNFLNYCGDPSKYELIQRRPEFPNIIEINMEILMNVDNIEDLKDLYLTNRNMRELLEDPFVLQEIAGKFKVYGRYVKTFNDLLDGVKEADLYENNFKINCTAYANKSECYVSERCPYYMDSYACSRIAEVKNNPQLEKLVFPTLIKPTGYHALDPKSWTNLRATASGLLNLIESLDSEGDVFTKKHALLKEAILKDGYPFGTKGVEAYYAYDDYITYGNYLAKADVKVIQNIPYYIFDLILELAKEIMIVNEGRLG